MESQQQLEFSNTSTNQVAVDAAVAEQPAQEGTSEFANSTRILDSLQVRLGLGLLRLTTEGRPSDVDATAVIHFALHQRIRVLDTADVYCLGTDDLHYGEYLVQRALNSWHGPREEVNILTKVGLTRPGGRWIPNGRPEHLRESIDGSLQALNVERLFLLQLHARDPRVPFDETLDALAELQKTGKVEHLGLCNVSLGELAQAQRHFAVAAVQNELSVLHRDHALDGMLALTREQNIAFLAHRSLGGHAKTAELTKSQILQPLAQRHETTPHEIALAALLEASDHVIPLVGATRFRSVRSSLKALEIELDSSDRIALSMGYSFGSETVAEAPAQDVPTKEEPEQTNTAQTATAMETFQQAAAPPQVASAISVSATATVAQNQGPGTAPEVVLLMGIQGAGKSELVSSYVQYGYARLNRDEMGGTLDDLIPHLQQLLGSGQNRVVLDNTYPTRASRAPVIAAAKTYGIPVHCRHLQTPLNEAHINISMRMIARYGMPLGPAEMKMFRAADPNLPPPAALMRWYGTFEPPYLEEGFDVIDAIPFVRRIDPTYTQRAVLLDVDGTVRTTRSGEYYPRLADDVQILPRRRETLARWVEAGYQLFFVSNQGGIAAGYVGHQAVQEAMYRTTELLEVPITEIVYCPHPAKPIGCYCRKPLPGLGVYLIERHHLSREHLIMVGDMQSDEEFAASLGIQYYDAETFFAEQ